ncbi:hypothetical protein EV421DRAFT_1719583, partial [Armillaria borealis]
MRHPADLLNDTVQKFKLNTEQEIAFRIMADTFIKREPEPFPLHMFLTGPGGTGKTHVIKALCDVMDAFGYRHAVRFIAPTGSAAALNNGLTVHKAFRIKICNRSNQHNNRSMA